MGRLQRLERLPEQVRALGPVQALGQVVLHSVVLLPPLLLLLPLALVMPPLALPLPQLQQVLVPEPRKHLLPGKRRPQRHFVPNKDQKRSWRHLRR